MVSSEIFKQNQEPEFAFNQWLVFLCSALDFTLGISLPVAMSAMFLEWQDEFQVSRAHAVVVHSTAASIVFGGAIIPGYLMNRFGARFTLLLGTTLATTGCLLSCFATSINYLIVTTGVIGGLGFSFIQLPSMPVVTMALPKYRSVAVSMCTFGSSSFNVILPFVYRFLVDEYSWRGTYMIISGFCLQTAIFGLIMTAYVPRPSSKQDHIILVQANKNPDYPKFKVVDKDVEFERHSGEEGDDNKTAGNRPCNLKLQGSSKDITVFEDEYRENVVKTRNENGKVPLLSYGRFQMMLKRFKNSKWNFLIDFMFCAIALYVTTSVAVNFTFVFVSMDFARTKGFSNKSTGLTFMFTIFISSLVGRLVMGPLNWILPSTTIMGIFGGIASSALILLGLVTDYITLMVFLIAQGLGIGGVVAILPKCVLDLECVSAETYPLALGFACTFEGIFDFIVPILVSHSVDVTGSYATILPLLGSIALSTSVLLVVMETYSSYKNEKGQLPDDNVQVT